MMDYKDNHKDADDCLNRAIMEDNRFAYAWNTRGYIHNYFEKYHRAIECFDKATDLDPNLTLAWYNKGYAYYCIRKDNIQFKKECLNKAKQCVNKAIEIDKNSYYAWHYRGYILFEIGQYDKAVENFHKAIEIAPRFGDAYYSKGTALDSLGRYQEAIECFNETLEKAKNMNLNERRTVTIYEKIVYAWNNKGVSFDSSGRYEKAIECFDKAIEYFQDTLEKVNNETEKSKFKIDLTNVWRNKGFSYARLMNHEKAIECFNKAIDIDPSFALAWNSKGYHTIYYLENLQNTIENFNRDEGLKEGIECFNKAIDCFNKDTDEKRRYNDDNVQIDKNVSFAWYNKGYAFYCLNEYEKAIECFDKAIEINHRYADAYYSKGVSLYRVAGYSEAVYNANGKNLVHQYSSKLYRIIDCFEEAIECFSENENKNFKDAGDEEENKNFAFAWYNKGIILHSLGRYEEAIECFDETLKVYFKLDEAWYRKGIILHSLGRYEEAIECFDKAIENFDKHKERKSLRHELDLFDLYFMRGQSKYSANFRGALDDFSHIDDQKINDNRKKSLKYNNIGLCFYQLELQEKAVECFNKAIDYDPQSVYAHYNVAVLYNNKNEKDKTKESLDKCLNIDGNFSDAKDAKKKLERPEHVDWYNWWFGKVKGKKILGVALIVALITFIAIPLSITERLVERPFVKGNSTELTYLVNKGINNQIMAWLVLAAGALIGMLLLPNLQKFKMGTVELQTIPIDAKAEFSMKPHLASIDPPPLVSMPFKYHAQSFRMPLAYQRQHFFMPPDPVRMPKKL